MADSSTLDPERVQAALRLESAGMLPPEHLAAVQRLRSAGQFPDPMTSSSTTTTPTSGTPDSEPTVSAATAYDAPPFLGGLIGAKGGEATARTLTPMIQRVLQPMSGEAGQFLMPFARQPRFAIPLAIGGALIGSALGRGAGNMVSNAALNVSPDRKAPGNDASIEAAGGRGMSQGLGAEAISQGLGNADDALRVLTKIAARQGGVTGFAGTVLDGLLRASGAILTPDRVRPFVNAGANAIEQPATRRVQRTPTTTRTLSTR